MNYVNEYWKPCPDFEQAYIVSNLGRVMRTLSRPTGPAGGVLKPHVARDGYLRIRPCHKGRQKTSLLHRYVARAFLGEAPQGKPEVNHLDGDKGNNKAANLEWCSPTENIRHSFAAKNRTVVRGEGVGTSKLREAQVREIRELHQRGTLSLRALALRFGVNRRTIGFVVARGTWAHV